MTQAIALIPARGGSKGLPRKNIRLLLGQPLIHYSIAAARNARSIDRILVSTEDAEIATIARQLGAEVLERPEALADDVTSSNAVLANACSMLAERGEKPDIVVYLQATDIFRPIGLIDRCIEALTSRPTTDSAFAAYAEHKNYWRNPEEPERLLPLSDLPRQNKPAIYREDTGLACATRFHTLQAHGRIGHSPAIVAHHEEYAKIDIHTAEDLWLAEAVMQRHAHEQRFAFQR
jgi:CMP-N,N'-diacetyllegionaminic acid synthase